MRKAEQIRFEGKAAEIYAHIVAERRQYTRRVIAFVMASVMLLLLVMQGLMIRGLSLENIPNCGLEEHIHTEECMQAVLSCGEEARPASYRLECPVTVHQHTAACYDDQNNLICGKADTLVHRHTDSCYDSAGVLVCNLPALEKHTHTDACFKTAKVLVCDAAKAENHVHTDSCYEIIPGGLVCALEESQGHVHTSECYSGGQLTLICGQNENPGHVHTDACTIYVRDTLICTETGEDHEHTDACYKYTREYTCGLEKGAGSHTHTAACFVQEEQTLTCQVEEGSGAHEHTAACYAPDTRVLICGLTQESEHVHTDECYETQTVVICGLMELHTHTPDCYPGGDTTQPPICGLWELKEHAHDENCLVLMDPGHTHTGDCYTEICVCDKEEHLHHSGCYMLEGTGENSEQQEEPSENAEPIVPQEPDEETETTASEETSENTETTVPQEPDENTETTAPQEPDENTETTVPQEPDENTETTAPQEPDENTETTAPQESNEETETTASEENPEGTEIPQDTAEIQLIPEAVASAPRMLMSMAAAPVVLAAAAPTEAISIEPYVTEVNIKYRLANSTETGFKDYKGEELPGDASLRVLCDFSFDRYIIVELKNNGGVMSFRLPDGLRAITPGMVQYIDENGHFQPSATMDVVGDTAYLYFDDYYLNNVVQDTATGTFYITAQANLDSVNSDGELTLQVGNPSATVKFEDDLIAKYGDTTISKSANPTLVQDSDGHYYIRYTVTITADEYGCPDVRVEDSFTLNGEYIEGYALAGILVNGATVPGWEETSSCSGAAGSVSSDGNSMVWNIGTMEAYETRTLTYLVQVKDQYIGAKKPGTISNKAQPYSKDYPRESAEEDFSFHSEVDMRKISAEPITNADGTVTLKYLIWVTADSNNSYTLKNVEIKDTLSADSDLLQYISFADGKFLVYLGKVSLENYMNGTATDTIQPVVDASGKSFTCNVGELAPGKSASVVYEVTVKPGFFAAAGNEDGKIHNVSSVFAGGEDDVLLWNANNFRTDKYLAHKEWTKKTAAADRTEGVIPVQMSGSVYDQSGNLTNVTSFEISDGSFPYTVTVNEDADWDISKAELKDRLTSQYMRFTGYVKVESCDADGNVINTVWVNIDDLKTFTLVPGNIGLGTGEYAVRLTYYAKLVDNIPTNLPQIGYSNAFSLTGNVGYGGTFYGLGGTEVTTSDYVTQDVYFNVEKLPWYYDPDSGLYNDHTAAYWVIRVDADKITAGTELLDEFLYSGQWEDNAWLGAYILDEATAQSILNNGTWDSVTESGILADKTPVALSYERSGATMKITFPGDPDDPDDDIELAKGQSVYIFLRLHVNWTLSEKGSFYYTENKISHAFGDNIWIPDNTAIMELKYYDGIKKGSDGYFTWDGETMTWIVHNNTSGVIGDEYKSTPGTYVQWFTKVNPHADLQGTYLVTDEIPDGLELSYVYLSWKNTTYNDSVKTIEVPSLENDRWTLHTSEAGGYGTTYYYTRDNEVCWCVTGLQTQTNRLGNLNRYSADFTIVCRVTGADAILSGEKTGFDNTVQVSSLDGSENHSASASQEVTIDTMEKKVATVANLPSGVCAFELVVNPLGENLLPNATTITLVDVMSKTMKLNLNSVSVCDKNTKEALAYTMAQEKDETGRDVMRITIPDDRAVLVSYQCYVQGKPGDTVAISNDAYWEGYEDEHPNARVVANFNYDAEGLIYTSSDPRLEIQKRNQDDANEYLSGAKFTVTEMMLQDGELVVNPGGGSWDESYCTTGEDGKVLIGEAKILKWNTVYKIVETEAPAGYVLDTTPKYFVAAQIGKSGYDQIEANYNDLVAKGVDVYFGSLYVYTALDEEAVLTVTKNFAEDGQPIALQDGQYTFVLYKVKTLGGVDRYYEESRRVLTIQNGVAQNTVTFRGLDESEKYVIRELDSAGNRVGEDALAMFDGSYIRVNYSGDLNENGYVTFAPGQADAEVTVTNNLVTIYLPETGGMGTGPIYLTAVVLMLSSGLLLLLRKRDNWI